MPRELVVEVFQRTEMFFGIVSAFGRGRIGL